MCSNCGVRKAVLGSVLCKECLKADLKKPA